jgi:S1-C subfamily serine protease
MKRLVFVMFLGSCSFLGGAAVMTVFPRLSASAVAQSSGENSGGGNNNLNRTSEHFENVARKVSPAVVYVEATKPPQPNNSSSKKRALEETGSGVIVKVQGRPGYFVLTNNHVIEKARPNQITINLADGRLFRPSKIWADPESDVALLALDNVANLPSAPLGDSDSVRVGQWVLAIGSPFGLNQTVTHGIISARERGQVSLGSTIRIKDFLQTDAAINPGSSGGPLVNLNGQVIGINTAIASNSGSNSGVAFSIPVTLVKRVMTQLLEKGHVSRGYLGMQLAQSFEAADALKLGLNRVQGAWVETVYTGTPAARAGLRVNDVILKVDSISIRNENHLINLISTLPPGQKIRLIVWRNRKMEALDAVVGDWAQGRSRFRTAR